MISEKKNLLEKKPIQSEIFKLTKFMGKKPTELQHEY